jgi:hypothetical protein
VEVAERPEPGGNPGAAGGDLPVQQPERDRVFQVGVEPVVANFWNLRELDGRAVPRNLFGVREADLVTPRLLDDRLAVERRVFVLVSIDPKAILASGATDEVGGASDGVLVVGRGEELDFVGFVVPIPVVAGTDHLNEADLGGLDAVTRREP